MKQAHINSQTTISIRDGTIVGTFHRIKPGVGNLTDDLAILTSLEYVYELLFSQKWRLTWVNNAIHSIMEKSPPESTSFFARLNRQLKKLKVSNTLQLLRNDIIIRDHEFLHQFQLIVATLTPTI